jgi:hypothetical protein
MAGHHPSTVNVVSRVLANSVSPPLHFTFKKNNDITAH